MLSFEGDSFSWRFVRLGSAALVIIVSPCDERLQTDPGPPVPRPGKNLRVCAQVWSARRIASVELHAFDSSVPMVPSGNLWTATIAESRAVKGEHELLVER